MPGAAVASSTTMEAVEPQSLKKLSLKSLKRALDFFSPTHGQCAPPDPASKQIRLSYKLHAEYGLVKDLFGKQAQDRGSSGDHSAPSSELALIGSESRDSQKDADQSALTIVPSVQPRGFDTGGPSRNVPGALISVLGSSERNQSTSALMERIPSRWPRPMWRPPWKNYRVISGHLGWVRSIAFDPSNTWFCTGSADRTIKASSHRHIFEPRPPSAFELRLATVDHPLSLRRATRRP